MSPPSTPFHGDIHRLIAGHLDSFLSADEEARLERLVTTDPNIALTLARAAMVHDRLRDLFREEPAITGQRWAIPGTMEIQPIRSVRRWLAIFTAVAFALFFIVIFQSPSGSGVATASAIERLIAAASSPVDREYRISVLDHGPHGSLPPVVSGGRGRKPGIEGASLFVRGADQFVLIRRFGDGTEFITGSDGTTGWAVPPKGRVHLSQDPRRFRRGVPGEHEEVPFLDLRAGFDGLRRGYHLALETEAGRQQRLEARRRGRRNRGPETVRVWFDEAGVATRIEIEGLPIEEGMPRSVAMSLVSQQDRDPAFYTHETHHLAERPVDWE